MERLRVLFEGREAIYVEKGTLRVKVTDVVCCDCGFMQANLSARVLQLIKERGAEFKAVSG